jgi:hypothetical protein
VSDLNISDDEWLPVQFAAYVVRSKYGLSFTDNAIVGLLDPKFVREEQTNGRTTRRLVHLGGFRKAVEKYCRERDALVPAVDPSKPVHEDERMRHLWRHYSERTERGRKLKEYIDEADNGLLVELEKRFAVVEVQVADVSARLSRQGVSFDNQLVGLHKLVTRYAQEVQELRRRLDDRDTPSNQEGSNDEQQGQA